PLRRGGGVAGRADQQAQDKAEAGSNDASKGSRHFSTILSAFKRLRPLARAIFWCEIRGSALSYRQGKTMLACSLYDFENTGRRRLYAKDSFGSSSRGHGRAH